jgi:hypothetical protein
LIARAIDIPVIIKNNMTNFWIISDNNAENDISNLLEQFLSGFTFVVDDFRIISLVFG